MFGDKACEFDCTVFGMVAQLLWQMPGSPIKTYIEGKCHTRFQSVLSFVDQLLV